MVACGLGRETLRLDFEKRKSKVVFGLELREKRWSHGGVGVLWWWREKRRGRERERERERNILILQKEEKQEMAGL